MTAVPLIVVASDMIAIFKEDLELDASGFRQTELKNKILQMRILHIPAEHLIPFGLSRGLPNHLHLLDKLRVLPLKCRNGNFLIREGFPVFEDIVEINLFIWAI